MIDSGQVQSDAPTSCGKDQECDLTNESQQQSNISKSHWGNRMEFFLATLGYTIGMGAISRFPYMCMKNGGGAFLLPLIIAMIVGGVPLYYAELALGQFSGLSPMALYSKLCPAFSGIGYACALLSTIVTVYMNMILTWSAIYIYYSLSTDVPWRGCNNAWNTEKCIDPFTNKLNLLCNKTDVYGNDSMASTTPLFVGNTTTSECMFEGIPEGRLLPSEDFWNNVILEVESYGLDKMGGMRWHLVVSSFCVWLLTFLCLIRGIKSLGKVVYVTATAPYILLTILIIRALTLDGAIEGVIFYVKPDFMKLLDHNVWIEAFLQMFFSLGPAWGVLITMASYNKFNRRFDREAVLIPMSDLFTCFCSGLAIFPVVGFMAKQANVPIERFDGSSVGLPFIIFPQAIAEMPVSPLWSVLFFSVLFFLGIDSQFGGVEIFLTGIMDLQPRLRNHKTIVTGLVITGFFLVGLPFCTTTGIYIYAWLDWYVSVITLPVVAFLEIVIVAYIYGVRRFSADVKLMLGIEPQMLWKVCWLVTTPIFMGSMIFLVLGTLQAPLFRGYQFPPWSMAVGWLAAATSFAPIPIMFVYRLATSPQKSFKQKLIRLFTPTADWRPAVEIKQAKEDDLLNNANAEL